MRNEYSTRQKRELLSFMKDHTYENFSLDEVVFRLGEQGTQVGRTTAYRFLEALAEQGCVRKYQNAQGVTQYQHIDEGADCGTHFHLLCMDCGTLQHVDCELMETLTRHIRQDHGFILDARSSILTGLCAQCSRKREDGHGTHHAQ